MKQPRNPLLFMLIFGCCCQQATATTARQYELGTTYLYDYTTAVLLNGPLQSSQSSSAQRKDVGYQITAQVEVTAFWQDPSDFGHLLLELLMKNPKLSVKSQKNPEGFLSHSSPLDEIKDDKPIYLDWNHGKVLRIFNADSDSVAILNLKRGVGSLFQIQCNDAVIEEIDASGLCNTTYVKEDDYVFHKKKNNCKYTRRSPYFTSAHQILGVQSTDDYNSEYVLKRGFSIIESLSATESHNYQVAVRLQSGASVNVNQVLQLKGESPSKKITNAPSLLLAVEGTSKSTGSRYIEGSLQLEQDVIGCSGSFCKPLRKVVGELKSALKSSQLASSKAADAFVHLVPPVRRSSKEEILEILQDPKNKDILPQLLDVIAAAQTDEAHQAALEKLHFNSKTAIGLAERYLISTSLSTHPSEYLLEDILRLCQKSITNEKLIETASLTLAALTRTFCADSNNCDKKVVSKIREYLTDSLQSCQSEECNQLYLRSLKNLAFGDTLPILLKYIRNKNSKTSVEAIKAIRSLPSYVFDDRTKDLLEDIYFQVGFRYDSSVRTLSLDILLEHEPRTQFLRDVLIAVATTNAVELNTYSLQRILEYSEKNPSIRKQIREILRGNQRVNNYNVLAQGGISTAFSRFFYVEGSGNASFSSSTETVTGGLLKRSAFDVFLNNEAESFQLLSFGVFAGGLGALAGGAENSDDEEEEATAGLEIMLGTSQLRPLVFFVGQGELMGHVWSGTASERTTALQATVLLQDHKQITPLQNGFVVALDVLGAVSFDFSGQIQISIWNRDAHSLLENAAAWELEGSLRLATPFVNSQVDFEVGAQAKIDFTSDLSFYDGISMCFQMSQPKFDVKYTIEKQESIPGTKHKIHKRKHSIETVPGRTYALNQKNSLLCNKMFSG